MKYFFIFRILGEASSSDKQELIRLEVLTRLLIEIEQCSHLERITKRSNSGDEKRRRGNWIRRPSTTSSTTSRGIGYGRGSTKSRWDIERTVEERIAQEEHLMWLMCALTTFLCGDALSLLDENVNLGKNKNFDLVKKFLD